MDRNVVRPVVDVDARVWAPVECDVHAIDAHGIDAEDESRILGDDVHVEPARRQRRQQLGRVPLQVEVPVQQVGSGRAMDDVGPDAEVLDQGT